MGGTRGQHGLTINNSPNSELAVSGAQDRCLKLVSWRRVEVEFVDLQWLTGQVFACNICMNVTLHHIPGQEDL